MNKEELEKELIKLNREWATIQPRKYSNDVIKKIVGLCEPYLKQHPHDTDIWIQLALAVYVTSYADDIKAIECMNAILSYDPLNPYALIILAYIESHMFGITDATFEKLCSVKFEDNEIMSMIEYVKSWYYSEHKNDEFYQKVLENSVALCKKHVRNCVNLGGLYIEQGRIAEGKKLQDLARSNITEISNIHNIKYFNITDINHFLNERIKGTRTTTDN